MRCVLFFLLVLSSAFVHAQEPKLMLPIGHTDRISSAQFSLDGKKIITASSDHTAKIWDATSGLLLVDLKGHTDRVNTAYFSTDSKKIVTASDDYTAKVWDAISGLLLADLKGHTERVYDASFSPDGKKIITASSDHTAKVWDATSGLLLADLKGHTGAVYDAKFSSNGKEIITISRDHTAKVWNAASGLIIANIKGPKDEDDDIQFSPDGTKIVTASKNGTAKVWDAASGLIIANFKGHKDEVSDVQFSSDGSKIVTASEDGTAKVWDVAAGVLLADLKGHTSWVTSAQFSPDGKKIFTVSGGITVKIWSAASGLVLIIFKGHTNKVYSSEVYSAEFSPDSKKVITAFDSTAKVWDVTSGLLLADIKGHTNNIHNGHFSPDGKKVITTSSDGTVKIWDAGSGLLLADIKGHTSSIYDVQFSPDGKKVVTASFDSIAKIWDASSGLLLADLKGYTSIIYDVQFSPDGKKVVTASSDNTAKIWDAGSGLLLADLKGHTSSVANAQFSPDGRMIVTISLDKTCKLWNAETGELFYTFFAIDSTDYLVVDKYNRYDGTEGARKLLYFTCGTEVISLNQVKDSLWVPNLEERIIRGETINSPKLSDLNLCGLIPLVEKVEGNSNYSFAITPRRGGLGETAVFVNGIEVKRYRPVELTKKGTVYQLNISETSLQPHFIGGQQNAVIVKAFTAGNGVASRGVSVIGTAGTNSAPPNLFAVMVGVSDYKGTALDLQYAAKDAQDLSHALALSAGKLLNANGTTHVFIYNIHTGQNRAQFPEKKTIRQVFEEIGKKATSNDILLVFFAGHGVTEGSKKQFYFLTADASPNADIAATGISMAELGEWMKPDNIKAGKRILILDACNSGQAINDLITIGNKTDNYIAVRSDEESNRIKAIENLNGQSGMMVLSASASNQSAYEMGRYSQGLLTYALLKAMKQQDMLQNGSYLNVDKWFTAAKETVTGIITGSSNLQQPQKFGNGDFNIGIIDRAVTAAIILPQEKPLFTASNFQNKDETIGGDDLELSDLLNGRLRDMGTRSIANGIEFIANSSTPDAYALKGTYEVKGNEVIVNVNLWQNRKNVYRLAISGTMDKLPDLVNSIITKAEEWIASKK